MGNTTQSHSKLGYGVGFPSKDKGSPSNIMKNSSLTPDLSEFQYLNSMKQKTAKTVKTAKMKVDTTNTSY
jgi:hypothetical protein